MCFSVRVSRYSSFKGLACGGGGFWLETAVQGPKQRLWRDLKGTIPTSLYIIGKFRKQRGVIGRPSWGLGREVQREVQKGNNDRCTVCPSAWDFSITIHTKGRGTRSTSSSWNGLPATLTSHRLLRQWPSESRRQVSLGNIAISTRTACQRHCKRLPLQQGQ